jgi:uncharacterized integral membrane protein
MTSDPPVSPDLPPRTAPSAPPTPAKPQPKPATPAKPARPAEPPVKFTRAAAAWTALIVGFLVLIVLLIFITQNTESVQLTFIGWRWNLPLGVAILLAAVSGGLLTVAAGSARIFQLRRAAKRNLKAQR